MSQAPDSLFDIPVSLSPRLAWLERHCLTLRKRTDAIGYECALDAENFGRGETEDEACIDFCLKTKLQHYSQE